MPKIEVSANALYTYMGKKVTGDDFLQLLPAAKAELDDEAGDTLKIELNDTNRPDLWSTAGLGRQLRIYLGGSIPDYPFFSRKGDTKDCGNRIVEVDSSVKDIRPYEIAFVIKRDKGITQEELDDIIQTQEKLCWNYGRKRKSISMGIYRNDLLTYPIKYYGADPDKTEFIPLDSTEKMNLREILKKHPKGQEFGSIIEDFPAYPFIEDANGNTLSMPPVINSNHLGAVKVGDKELFIEITGTALPSILITASIVACDFYDSGFEILPVKVKYPYDTPFGREITAPYYFQEDIKTDIKTVNKILGEDMTPEVAAAFCQKLGCKVVVNGDTLTLTPAEYRNDFLHPVDIVEDIMIGKSLPAFVPIMIDDFTKGSLSPATILNRQVKDIMVGLGFQEMVYNYLGSAKDFIEKMNMSGEKVVRISNPMSENFEYLRPSILSSLLNSESVSGNAVYPHHIFEAGKTAVKDSSENTGVATLNSLGFLSADRDAGFNMVNSQLSAIMFYMSAEYSLKETEDSRFINGRCAQVISNGKEIGIMGEVHPQVLENWGIQMPCAVCEINLDLLLRSPNS